MEKTIITVALCVLAALMLAMIVKVVKGPRFTDRILAEVKNVNRVCYDMSPKPSATIEWE